jgi:hypothetical protein
MEEVMAARLGNALYWLGCAAAIVIAAYPLVFILEEWGNYEMAPPDPWSVGAYLVCAAAVWLAGRIARYFLAGK